MLLNVYPLIQAGQTLFNLEILIVIWFTVEFLVRLWSAGTVFNSEF